MSTTMYRWTVTILVALVILLGAGLALQAAPAGEAPLPPAPQQDLGGGGRIMFS
jgi:hypothetical protein